jgi:hypothetical protein
VSVLGAKVDHPITQEVVAMNPISLELKRAVKCWRRRRKNPKVTDAEKAEAAKYGGSGAVKAMQRLERNAKRVERAARDYEENLIFAFENDDVVLIWNSMWQKHQIYLVKRSVSV